MKTTHKPANITYKNNLYLIQKQFCFILEIAYLSELAYMINTYAINYKIS